MNFVFTTRVVKLSLYVCVFGGAGVYDFFGWACMYMEFAFGWCANVCKRVGAILVIGGIFMVCVSH